MVGYAQVTCIYLFHELPPSVRKQATEEMARVIRPGGMIVLTDAAQLGDRPEWDKVCLLRAKMTLEAAALAAHLSVCTNAQYLSMGCIRQRVYR